MSSEKRRPFCPGGAELLGLQYLLSHLYIFGKKMYGMSVNFSKSYVTFSYVVDIFLQN